MLMNKNIDRVIVIRPTDDLNLSSAHLSLKLNFSGLNQGQLSAFPVFFDFTFLPAVLRLSLRCEQAFLSLGIFIK